MTTTALTHLSTTSPTPSVSTNMIPKPRNWKVTFYKQDGEVLVGYVFCVKRFAKSLANEDLGYPAFDSKKITVSLCR